jgi:acetyl-CoA synthetase
LQNGKCLKEQGIQKRIVFVLLPMIPELAITTLACARIEPFTRLFCRIFRFGSSSRINDSECKMVITSDGGYRGTKRLI